MSITAKRIQEIEQQMTPEEKAQVEQDLQREITRINELINELAKKGQGLEWDGQSWAIVNVPGLNTRFDQEAEEMKRPGPRGPRRTKSSLIAREKAVVNIPSGQTEQVVLDFLRYPGSYKSYHDEGVATFQRTFARGSGHMSIEIRGTGEEGWSEVLEAVGTLGAGCRDTFMAALILALDSNGTQNVRHPLLVSVDDILEICGKKKQHGSSFSALQRAETTKFLKTLSQTWIHVALELPQKQASTPGKPGRKRKDTTKGGVVIKAEGVLIDLLSFKIGAYQTITGEELWEKREMAIGKWAQMVELHPKTAVMLRKVLEYSAKNERYQKDLGYYLTLMFRNNASRHGGKFVCSMSALLKGAGIAVPPEKGAFRDAVEQALAALKEDDVIGEYGQVVDTEPNAEEREARIRCHDKGWWDTYAARMWRFDPPQYAKEQYKAIGKGQVNS